MSQCPVNERLRSQRQEAAGSGGQCNTCPPSPCVVCQLSPGAGDNNDRDTKQYESGQGDLADDDDDTDGVNEEDDVNIDDGLLDDAFDESTDDSGVYPRNNNNNNQCNSCDMAVCVMGGSNDQVDIVVTLIVTCHLTIYLTMKCLDTMFCLTGSSVRGCLCDSRQ